MDFREYIRKKYLKSSDRILEFGPLNRSTVSKDTHPNIYFADIRSTEDVIKMYTSNDYLKSTGITVDLDSIIPIDYVIKDSYKKTFKNVEKFDVAILSHVIEHIPDIIEFFKDIINVLKEDGRLVIIYPDANYCFDHFRNGTSFIDAYDVYKNKDSSSKRVFDFVYNVVHENNPDYFWNDANSNEIMPSSDFSVAVKAADRARKGELPEDTHFWPFSNYQLIKFLYDMDRAGLLDFDIEEFHPTPKNYQECLLILTPKKKPGVKNNVYKKFFDQINPAVKRINDAKKINDLKASIENLKKEKAKIEKEKLEIQNELSNIKNSKKWGYIEKIAKAKNRLTNG